MKVWCNHNMHTCNFLCKHPENGKISVNVEKGIRVLIDECLADKYPSVFTKIETVEAAPAQDSDIKRKPDDATDEPEIIEPEATDSEFYGDSEPGEYESGADLVEVIDNFKTKKKLVEYAESCGTELIGKTLKVMKAELKELWKL